MYDALLPYIGWIFLPNLVSGWIQTVYYTAVIRAGDPKPQLGSAKYVKHRRRILIAVIVAYLLYTIVDADYQLQRQGDFYQALGVPHHVDDRQIKSRFRRLATMHHPDKIAAFKDQTVSEAHFVHLKLAQDTLLHPTKRWVYDRFGPDMLDWRNCSSIRDYLLFGLRFYLPTYTTFGMAMIVAAVTGYLQWDRFWRYLLSACLLLLELYVSTRPYYPPFLTKVINPLLHLTTHPPLLPFQLLILARKTILTLFIGLSQLGPLFQAPTPASSSPNAIDPQQLLRLEKTAQANDEEATRLLGLEMAPLAGDEHGVKNLKGKVKEWLVQNTIRNDPEVRDAVGRALGKRRVGALVGTGSAR